MSKIVVRKFALRTVLAYHRITKHEHLLKIFADASSSTRVASGPYQLPIYDVGMWCHQRESNLRLSITNTLLFHLTMAAFVLVCVVGEKGLEPSRLAARVPKTRVSAIPPLPHLWCAGRAIKTWPTHLSSSKGGPM